jgi:hypothetical protein
LAGRATEKKSGILNIQKSIEEQSFRIQSTLTAIKNTVLFCSFIIVAPKHLYFEIFSYDCTGQLYV